MQIKDNSEIVKYKEYLSLIDSKISKFFSMQKPYIFCKKGCSFCCQKGEYPCSSLEFQFLYEGFNELDNTLKNIILEKADKIKNTKNEFKEKKFLYECPFLIDGACSVYNYRPLICRTFGLPFFDQNEKIKVPFCVEQGLNYSQVYDGSKDTISQEMFEQTGFKQEPLAFNLRQEFLIKEVGEENLGLDFGDKKTIIDWF